MQLVDIYVSYTEMYLELFKGSVFKEMVYMNCTLKEIFFPLHSREAEDFNLDAQKTFIHKRNAYLSMAACNRKFLW